MRALHRGFAAYASVAALLLGTAVAAEVHAAPTPSEEPVVAVPDGDGPDGFGASCHAVVEGSRVTAHCRNPYPRTDRIRLHVECDPWWDLDTDSAPVDVAPADHATVTARCWKRVRSAWVTHERVPDPPPAPPASDAPRPSAPPAA
ncbi:hypothetical protein [Streptomyces omiyaensis]|uniref:Secreted protein n=1 Tax=Streptomyces omiyaensis TaxID=68247 RepID=A0ABW7BSL8_9ACTN|nr:hypothetical protein [Streptomyces omiyaensis]GGY57152.1 hypothetical protein GCM10010363_43250 [Streptomyces omiyaensis]